MNRYRSALLWLLVLPLLGTVAAPSATGGGGPGRPGIDIEAYRFELTLRDDTDEIAGRATVTLRFTADGVVEVPLDLTGRGGDGRGMDVVAVTSAGAPLDYRHENDLLTVRMARPGTAGELDSRGPLRRAAGGRVQRRTGADLGVREGPGRRVP